MLDLNLDSASLGLTSNEVNSTSCLQTEAIGNQQSSLFSPNLTFKSKSSLDSLGDGETGNILNDGTNSNCLISKQGEDIRITCYDESLTTEAGTNTYWIKDYNSKIPNTISATTPSEPISDNKDSTSGSNDINIPGFNLPDISSLIGGFFDSFLQITLQDLLAAFSGSSVQSESISVSSQDDGYSIASSIVESSTGNSSTQVTQNAGMEGLEVNDDSCSIPEKKGKFINPSLW